MVGTYERNKLTQERELLVLRAVDMSHKTYNILWRRANDLVRDLLVLESAASNSDGNTMTTVPAMNLHLGTLYVLYLSTVHILEDCYDQMAHPQKRKEILILLECVIGRMLEVYDLLVVSTGTEYVALDSVLKQLSLAPSVLALDAPRYFKADRTKELEERDKLLTALLTQYNMKQEELQIKDTPPPVINMSLEEAIKIIQVNERGRQGRRKLQEMRSTPIYERQMTTLSSADQEPAAIMIQKIFRGYLTRQKTKARREEELVFLGMNASQRKNIDPIEKAAATGARRKLLQNQNELEYQQAVVRIRQALLDQEGPNMKEGMQDDIRKYFQDYKEQLGKFPVFPDEPSGGSAKMLQHSAPTTAKPLPPTTSKPSATSSKPSAPTSKSSKPAGTSKGTKKEAPSEAKASATIEIPPSNFLPDIHLAVQRYLQVWAERDEDANFAQKHDAEMIRDNLRPQVEAEIRKQVDEILRQELDSLKDVVENKKQGKKKGKKSKSAEEQPKEDTEKSTDATDKKKKKKAVKDPTAERSVQSIYAELVNMNIIVNVSGLSRSKKKDFVNVYCESTLQATLFGTMHAIMNLCILPLGCSGKVSRNLPAPLVPRSLLIVAPPAYGKSMLCNIIAYECGAVMFNLDPQNLSSVTNSKSMSVIIHMIFKVAKAMAPAVIFVDNVERVFMKPKKKRAEASPDSAEQNADGGDKPPSTAERSKKLSEPELAAMMRKDLLSQIASLQAGDRVLVVGMTSSPGMATIGGQGMGFDRALVLTHPDPRSLSALWNKIVKDAARDMTPNESSILARITGGLPAGLIQKIVDAVVQENANKKALDSQDFVQHIAKLPSAKDVQLEMEPVMQWWSSKRPTRTTSAASSDSKPEVKGDGKDTNLKASAKPKATQKK